MSQNREDSLYLTDLGRCLPAHALADEPRLHHWQLQPYVAESMAGQMLVAGEETAAPEIRCRLDRTGWHRVLVGVYPEHRAATQLELKLSGDAGFSGLHLDPHLLPAGHQRHTILELWWQDADLTGQELHLRQVITQVAAGDGPGVARCAPVRIAYIKLEPLGPAEIAVLQADRGTVSHRRLYAHNDAHGYLFLRGEATAEAVYREIAPYRHSDFGRLYWECGAGDLLFYLGQAGRLPTCDGVEDFARQGDRLHAQAWRSFRAQGLDPLRLALAYAHEMGLEFHASYRTAGFFYPAPLEQWNPGSLYQTRPDLRMVDQEGRPGPRISYAFADTRRFVIDLLLEVAGFGVDGVCILYNRRPPLLGYEPPLVDGFVATYGEDPRRLPAEEPRWLRYRSGALTEFHRQLRHELDALSARLGRSRVAVSACVLNQEENLRHGLDLDTWVREGLVDTLIPYTSAPELDSMAEAWPDQAQVHHFLELIRHSDCQLALNVMPRHQSAAAFRHKAAALYGAGVERLFFWDAAGPSGRANYGPAWPALRRLGHREEILSGASTPGPDGSLALIPLLQVGDYDLTYQTPG